MMDYNASHVHSSSVHQPRELWLQIRPLVGRYTPNLEGHAYHRRSQNFVLYFDTLLYFEIRVPQRRLGRNRSNFGLYDPCKIR